MNYFSTYISKCLTVEVADLDLLVKKTRLLQIRSCSPEASGGQLLLTQHEKNNTLE